MAANCKHHPGRQAERLLPDSVALFLQVEYCKYCLDSMATAIGNVNRHVTPKSCFITYTGREWAPIPGTGCAHWVAHQKGIRHGLKCMAGYTLRVPDLIATLPEMTDLKEVQVGDIYVNLALDHCGIVDSIRKTEKNGNMEIDFIIVHCSSRAGGVIKSDFKSFFGGHGRFYRYGGV
jgi:hypothetical protein